MFSPRITFQTICQDISFCCKLYLLSLASSAGRNWRFQTLCCPSLGTTDVSSWCSVVPQLGRLKKLVFGCRQVLTPLVGQWLTLDLVPQPSLANILWLKMLQSATASITSFKFLVFRLAINVKKYMKIYSGPLVWNYVPTLNNFWLVVVGSSASGFFVSTLCNLSLRM